MRDTDLYARILGVDRPWQVMDVELRLETGEVEVRVAYAASEVVLFPECGGPAKRLDVLLLFEALAPTP